LDKYQALHDFWSSFGIGAYDENTVPTGEYQPELPYITYSVAVSDFDHPVNLYASIWYYGSSWGPITKKLTEIGTAIGRGGIIIPCDEGAIWIRKGRTFAQRMSDPNDMIRRIYLTLGAEYLTAD